MPDEKRRAAGEDRRLLRAPQEAGRQPRECRAPRDLQGLPPRDRIYRARPGTREREHAGRRSGNRENPGATARRAVGQRAVCIERGERPLGLALRRALWLRCHPRDGRDRWLRRWRRLRRCFGGLEIRRLQPAARRGRDRVRQRLVGRNRAPGLRQVVRRHALLAKLRRCHAAAQAAAEVRGDDESALPLALRRLRGESRAA
mmetsp:Transcript_8815/g.22812  ORF Transcript_8815/g.22812 Transcript_8815/m.22812 type:complete len:202 (+) Transcript_8815:322-927(+)